MVYLLSWVSWLIAGVLSLVLIYLSVELCAGLARSGKQPLKSPANKWTGAILVPAHNEALSIADTVAALRVSAPDCRIVVVADNCSDNTAELARSAGAEAISRNDPTRKGKGFALSYGRDFLVQSPPDAVIIVDADCTLSPGSADALITRAVQGNQPVQGIYVLETRATDSPLTGISNFALLVKNLVRARGLERLSGGTLLFGSGMAFPWRMYADLTLATSDAVEDLGLGLALAKQGVRVSFENGAMIRSPAVSGATSRGQRSRWEHGFMQTGLQNGLPLIASGLTRRCRHLLFIGMHMLVPPLAALILLCLTTSVIIAALFLNGLVSINPIILLSICLILLTIVLLLVWWREGRKVISGLSLVLIPFYVLWKVPIYLRFFTARQTGWNRTQRDGEQP